MDADRRFDPGHVLEIACGEPAFLSELAAVLRASTSRQLSGLRAALEASDRAEMMRLTHQLKGGLGTFGDARLNARANALEAMALTAPAEGLTALLDGLEADIAWLGQCLDALAEVASAPAPDDALTVVDTSGP